jgi:hypothetical protein
MAEGSVDFRIYFQRGTGSADPHRLDYFKKSSIETINKTMEKLFGEVNKLASTKLTWTIAWDQTAAERKQSWQDKGSSVIHVLRAPSNSLIPDTITKSSGGDAAGRTATLDDGVLSEIYVEDNMPADKLAHIAFHELMHNRLDVGATVVPINNSKDASKAGIHDVALGGGGLAATPTTGYGSLTAKNASLMAKNLITTVKQSSKHLLK